MKGEIVAFSESCVGVYTMNVYRAYVMFWKPYNFLGHEMATTSLDIHNL